MTLMVVKAAQAAMEVGILTVPRPAVSATALEKSMILPLPMPTTSSQPAARHLSAYSFAASKLHTPV